MAACHMSSCWLFLIEYHWARPAAPVRKATAAAVGMVLEGLIRLPLLPLLAVASAAVGWFCPVMY